MERRSLPRCLTTPYYGEASRQRKCQERPSCQEQQQDFSSATAARHTGRSYTRFGGTGSAFRGYSSDQEFPVRTSASPNICFPCSGDCEFATRAGPDKTSAALTARFCPSDEHYSPNLLPRPQILQPRSQCSALGAGRAQIRCSI